MYIDSLMNSKVFYTLHYYTVIKLTLLSKVTYNKCNSEDPTQKERITQSYN